MTLQEEPGGEALKPAKRKPGRKPGQRKRTPLEIARDRRLIMRLRLRYHLWTNIDIAVEVNKAYEKEEAEYEKEVKLPGGRIEFKLVRRPHVSPEQVGREIKALEELLTASAVNDILTVRRMMVAEYRELEAYCYERYEATIGTHVKTTKTEGENPSTRTEEEEISGQIGYLQLAQACKAKVAELLGVAVPKKIAPTNPDGTKPYDAFSENEELKRLATLFEGIAKGKPATFGGA
jgi:hypothetical protein